jgi:hypothetical protein
MLTKVKKIAYLVGIKPKPGSILFSPTLHYHYLAKEAIKNMQTPDPDETKLQVIISNLQTHLNRIPTEDEIFAFVFGTTEDRQRIWAEGAGETNESL